MANEYERFCDEVCARVRHATRREKQGIAEELADHMSDHAAALAEAGWDEAEARAKAVEAMGDAAEIGASLNREYPPVWLILSRALAVLIALAVIFCAPGFLTRFYFFHNNLKARTAPTEHGPLISGHVIDHPADYRYDMPANDVYRVYAIDLQYEEYRREGLAEGWYAYAAVCAYDKNPFGRVSSVLPDAVRIFAPDGSAAVRSGRTRNDGASYGVSVVPVNRGDGYLRIYYSAFGFTLDEQIPLDWEGVE